MGELDKLGKLLLIAVMDNWLSILGLFWLFTLPTYALLFWRLARRGNTPITGTGALLPSVPVDPKVIVSEVQYIVSPDLLDSADVQPPYPEDFGVEVQVYVGPKGSLGPEAFAIWVCTPRWLARRVPEDGPTFISHCLLIARFDREAIRQEILKRFNGVTGPTWEAVARKLSRHSVWEFEPT